MLRERLQLSKEQCVALLLQLEADGGALSREMSVAWHKLQCTITWNVCSGVTTTVP